MRILTTRSGWRKISGGIMIDGLVKILYEEMSQANLE